VYVKNLDERVKLPTLIETLRGIFAEYGNVLEVIAKKSLKRKGQAFVVYDSVDSAQNAIDELQGFDIFDKQMHLDFAKTRSDLTVLREEGEDGLETHKKQRVAEKERKQSIEAAARAKEQAAAKRAATGDLAERPAKTAKPAQAAGVVPDEYLPPNKVLFLRDLSADYGKDLLTTVFGRFPGFKEVRVVPGRTEIAFVEYENEEGAIQAKEQMNGVALGDKPIKVTFQRQ
jgi:U2 small nuclear ribonucleoprotein B''